MDFRQRPGCDNTGSSKASCGSQDSGAMFSEMDLSSSRNQSKSLSPYLEILVQPQSKFRYRYKSEMTGKHGSLLGVESTGSPGSKTYPTVKLHNFPEDAIIRCSIVCETWPNYPHPHILDVAKTSSLALPNEIEEEVFLNPSQSQPFVEIPVTSENDHTAIFQGMNIIFTGRKTMKKEILYKLTQLEDGDARKINSTQLDEITLGINLNVVVLCFEAIVRTPDNHIQSICSPILSLPIQHNKSIQTGDLRIVRIDKYTSCCAGDEEVFALVEKVDKHNIQVKFFELNHQGNEVWKAYGQFSKLDVHHQYAIVFKTPPYRSTDIDTDVDVWIELERPSDGAKSEKLPFKYKPIDRFRKMPKRQARNSQAHSSRHSFDTQEDSEQVNQSENSKGESCGGGATDQHNIMGTDGGTGTGSVKLGSDQKFPCDFGRMATNEQSARNKTVALGVALSVGASLHNWAETSDFTCVLQKLRHLLCLVNDNGNNALHTAILNQQDEPFTRILSTISSSPDISSIINEPNLQNLTPLSLAVLTNSEDYVRELISRGADMTISNLDGDLPLHLAVKANQLNCLKHLVRAPSASETINCFNYNSMTPLHLAVSEGSLDSINSLCCAKANLAVQEGTYGRTPLHIAVEKCSFASLLLLLKSAGESDIVNIQNYRGDTPLHCAASADLPTLCALLLYFGADPTIENFVRATEEEDEEGDDESGDTVFDVVSNPEIIKVLTGTMEDWEKILKTYTNLTEYRAEREKLLSLESIHFDSGIDIIT